jgi:hypothetical protein
MKTQLILRASIVFLGLFLAFNSSAQDVDTLLRMDTIRTGGLDTLPTVVITRGSAVNQRISKAFNNDFKDALNPRWFEINKRYLVKFISAEQKNTALYNKRGYLIYHIAYGTEKHLPTNVRDQIKTQYPRATITNTIYVNQANRKIWVINLEEGNELVLTRIEDDQLDEVQRLKTGSGN